MDMTKSAATSKFWGLYDSSRPDILGEVSFFSTLFQDGHHVVEVGAGSGCLTERLPHDRAALVSLVEPDAAGCAELHRKFEREIHSGKVQVHSVAFEQALLSQADAIFMPYHGFPMVNPTAYPRFFATVVSTLKEGGRFFLHFFNEEWQEKLRAQVGIQSTFQNGSTKISFLVSTVDASSHEECIEISDTESLTTDTHTCPSQVFRFRYWLCREQSVIQAAEEAGLKLFRRASSFVAGDPNQDAVILEFFKK